MHLKQIINVGVSMVFILLVGCTGGDFCLSNQQAVQASFYSGSQGKAVDTTLNSITLVGLENDSILYDSLLLQKLYLPLDLNRDTTSWLFIEEYLVGPPQVDTLYFVYERSIDYISGACGMTMAMNLDTVVHTFNRIDSIVVSYPPILYNENLENVKIFIRP